jgi:predicted methyltransferase
MKANTLNWTKLSCTVLLAATLAACGSMQSGSPPSGSKASAGGGDLAAGGGRAKRPDESKARANRPAAATARAAARKPAELVQFFGVKPGMTTVDLIALGGYITEVLSVAVGPKGKVYAQNPPIALQMRDGMYAKAITERLANNRLPNVVRVDGDLPASSQIPPGSVDVAITAMNYHDVRNMNPELGVGFLKAVYTMLKPGGVFGVTDHVGNDGANNAQLHRIPKHFLVEDAKAAGFVVEAESDMLAHPADDHTKVVFDPTLRGKTDQFVVRLRKPK